MPLASFTRAKSSYLIRSSVVLVELTEFSLVELVKGIQFCHGHFVLQFYYLQVNINVNTITEGKQDCSRPAPQSQISPKISIKTIPLYSHNISYSRKY